MGSHTRFTGVYLLLASLAVLATPNRAPARAPGIIQSLAAVPNEAGGRAVGFEWTILPERADEQLSCALDIDVDDPSQPDLSIPNCGENTSVDWTYDEPGTYQAALTVMSSAGGSDRVLVAVSVD